MRSQVAQQEYNANDRLKRKTRREQGLCTDCGLNTVIGKFRRCEECRVIRGEQTKIYRTKHRAKQLKTHRIGATRRRWSLKRQVMSQYGNQCTQCGETRLPCLQLDHINGDGSEHRKSFGLTLRGGSQFYAKLVSENIFPDSLRILCANCHSLRHSNGWETI